MKTRLLLTLIAGGMLLPGCDRNGPPAEPPASSRVAAVPTTVPWLEDAYARARLQAEGLDQPVVIDMWAPWCHTCLSMQQTVLKDPRVAAYADRFTWLAVDTDRPQNAEILTKYSVASWPTFFIVDAASETIQARLVGSGSVDEFVDFLERGAAAWRGARAEAEADASTLAALQLAGDRAAAAGDYDTARDHYEAALALRDLPARTEGELAASLVATRYKAKDWSACVAVATERLARVARARTSKALDFAAYALYCAPHVTDAEAAGLRTAVASEGSPIRAILDDPDAPISVDDRADGLRVVRSALDALGDTAGARALAIQQLTLLKETIEAAASPHEVMTYNWPLVEVAAYLGDYDYALATVAKNAAALPDEYDPPYRLAWLLLKSGDAKAALPHAETALAHVYGPRKGRVQTMVADIHKALGDAAAERAAREATVAIYQALPAGHQNPRALAAAQAALAAMSGDAVE